MFFSNNEIPEISHTYPIYTDGGMFTICSTREFDNGKSEQ